MCCSSAHSTPPIERLWCSFTSRLGPSFAHTAQTSWEMVGFALSKHIAGSLRPTAWLCHSEVNVSGWFTPSGSPCNKVSLARLLVSHSLCVCLTCLCLGSLTSALCLFVSVYILPATLVVPPPPLVSPSNVQRLPHPHSLSHSPTPLLLARYVFPSNHVPPAEHESSSADL